MAATASGSWATDETNGPWPQQRPRTDTYSSNETRSVPYPGYGARRKMSDYDVRSDSEYVNPRRTTGRPSSRPGHLAAAKKRSKNQLREKPSLSSPSGVDDSAWIHRDKLAQIEIREMQEAGYSVGRSRGAPSTEPDEYDHAEQSIAGHREEETDHDEYQHYDELEQKRMSTIPGAEEEEDETSFANQFVPEHDEHEDDDAPDAPALEQTPVEQTTPRGHQVRPSTSRIPIVKGNTPSSADRDSNAPRSRSGSVEQSGRLRSNSTSIPMSPADETTGTQSGSPRRSAGARKNAPSADGAETSELSHDRPGSSHANNKLGTVTATKQPGPGHQPRPSASTRAAPEGDPPWINSMFKPDPRLPPDQQMLPTHAKRMMQQQWAKEGKPSTVYDRDFMQLSDEELRNMVPPTVPPKLAMDTSAAEPPPTPPQLSPAMEVAPTFTLPPIITSDPIRLQRSPSPDKILPHPPPAPQSPDKILPDLPPAPQSPDKSDAGSIRPGTSGGYRITPTIPTLPPNFPLPSPRTSQGLNTQQPRPHAVPLSPTHARPHVPDLDEKDESEQKKGCCCVMM